MTYFTGEFFSEAMISRVHTHFFGNFSGYFLKVDGWKFFLFFSFDHLSKSRSASTKIFFEKVKEVGKKVHIHFFENVVSEKNLPLSALWLYRTDDPRAASCHSWKF